MRSHSSVEIQGHRGARGLAPENTLPAFELALDAGVHAIETDVHLTADGALVLYHDHFLSPKLCSPLDSGVLVESPISRLNFADLRGYRADRNPDPGRFPRQRSLLTPMARSFADERGIDPYAVPTVRDFFEFVQTYAARGHEAGKSQAQRDAAAHLIFDLELKRVPFFPDCIGDGFDGAKPALFEIALLEEIGSAGLLHRCRVRSFDHRSVRVIKDLEPRLQTAVLIAGTAPLDPGRLAREARAEFYCPDYRFLDADSVRRVHAEAIRVIPWTVNDASAWARLLSWGVDGITTDDPDLIMEFLRNTADEQITGRVS